MTRSAVMLHLEANPLARVVRVAANVEPERAGVGFQCRQGEAVGEGVRDVDGSGIVPAAGSLDPFAEDDAAIVDDASCTYPRAPGAVIGPGCALCVPVHGFETPICAYAAMGIGAS